MKLGCSEIKKEQARERIATLILGLTFGIAFFDRNSLSLLIPFVAKDIPLSNAQIGMLASALSTAWAISGLTIGFISDRIGHRKNLLVGAVAVFSLAALLSGRAHSFVALLGARTLMGLAEGPVLPLSQCFIAQVSSPSKRGRNMGLMQTALSSIIGGLAAPVVVVSLAMTFGWRSAFSLTAVPGLICALLILVGVPRIAPTTAAPGRRSEPRTLRSLLALPNVCVCIGISAMMVGWLFVGWTFLPLYLVSIRGFGSTQMSLLLSLVGISGAFAGYLAPTLSDRFGRRPVMILGCLLGILPPAAVLLGSTSVAIMTLLMATGWMAGGTFSIFMATIPSECVPSGMVATAMALVMGIGELVGGTAAPTIVGYLADRFTLAAAPMAQIFLAVLGAAFSLALRESAPDRIGSTALSGT